MKKVLIAAAVSAATLLASSSSFAQLTANATLTSNYMWRGLTQTRNKAALQGGLKYTASNGAYVGTWVSNVDFTPPADVYNYEHDVFVGYGGKFNDDISFDVNYLYYNYNSAAVGDFGEITGGITIGGFTAKLSMVTNTEADPGPGTDFDFGDTYYLSADYALPLSDDFTLGLHAGYQDGDFNEYNNGVSKGYMEYNVSLSKSGFTGMISYTDLKRDGSFATNSDLENDKVKFVIGYTANFEF